MKMVNLKDITDCLNWIIFKSPQIVIGCELWMEVGLLQTDNTVFILGAGPAGVSLSHIFQMKLKTF